METITATRPVLAPPTWAVLERHLLDLLDRAVDTFLVKYTRDDGSLIWRDEFPGRDGADDFYESCYNWPLLYLLGGSDRLLSLGLREWEAITQQLTTLGHVTNEYERGYDWFHQGEANLYFYFLCLADPAHPTTIERARRFAGLYLNEDPTAENFDPERKIIRAPHNGSTGPRWGFGDGPPIYGWSAGMARYGLPYTDVPGIHGYDDLKDPALAQRMGEVMQARMGKGDVVGNLAATSLATNAFLLTGDEKYRRWVVDYVDAWAERARRNGGLLPDNVGLSGQVGEYLGGKWYGGLYGWTWPHGFYNIAMAAIVAAENALLLTGEPGYLDLARTQIDRVFDQGVRRNGGEARAAMSLAEHWIGAFGAGSADSDMFLVPYRYGDDGWFDYQPLAPMYPAAVWHRSLETADWERIERLREVSGYDWRQVIPFRAKEDAGHEAPWLRFLAGENPGYPEEILRAALATARWRLDQIDADAADLRAVNIHHWQQLNPVTTEALVQLTLGAPAPIYNGGLLFTPIRYVDVAQQRPGLPPDVAALVTGLTADETRVEIVNLSPCESHSVGIQAGGFREHQFVEVRYDALRRPSDYPGKPGAYQAPTPAPEWRTAAVNASDLQVELPPGTCVQLQLKTRRYQHCPTLGQAADQG